MAFKVMLSLCASALLVQIIPCACLGNAYNTGIDVSEVAVSRPAGWASNGLTGLAGNGLAGWNGNGLAGWAGNGLVGNGLAGWNSNAQSSRNGNTFAMNGNGGGFAVTSVSPIAPSGLSVLSESVIEGPLAVVGKLPFLSAVTLEGQVPGAGLVDVSYGCGNGHIGMISEGFGDYAAASLAGGVAAAY